MNKKMNQISDKQKTISILDQYNLIKEISSLK